MTNPGFVDDEGRSLISSRKVESAIASFDFFASEVRIHAACRHRRRDRIA